MKLVRQHECNGSRQREVVGVHPDPLPLFQENPPDKSGNLRTFTGSRFLFSGYLLDTVGMRP